VRELGYDVLWQKHFGRPKRDAQGQRIWPRHPLSCFADRKTRWNLPPPGASPEALVAQLGAVRNRLVTIISRHRLLPEAIRAYRNGLYVVLDVPVRSGRRSDDGASRAWGPGRPPGDASPFFVVQVARSAGECT
jgi:hypothetical protein